MLSSTLLNLLVIPTLFHWMASRRKGWLVPSGL
jgi:Cu/Ag efflux pump CusA